MRRLESPVNEMIDSKTLIYIKELEDRNKELEFSLHRLMEYYHIKTVNIWDKVVLESLREKIRFLEESLDRKEEVNKKLRSDLLMYQNQYWCLTD